MQNSIGGISLNPNASSSFVSSTGNAILGIFSTLTILVAIACFIVGILYLALSKNKKRVLYGILIMVIPFVIAIITNLVVNVLILMG